MPVSYAILINIPNMLLLVKCYDIKMVNLPGGSFNKISYMQLTKKKNNNKNKILPIQDPKYISS